MTIKETEAEIVPRTKELSRSENLQHAGPSEIIKSRTPYGTYGETEAQREPHIPH